MIRRARPGDEAAVAEVVKSVYDEYGFTWDPDDYHADLSDLQAHYPEPETCFWVAEAGPIRGCGALVTFTPIPGEPGRLATVDGKRRIAATQGSLERLYVHPEARRHGLGTALFEQVIAEAKARCLLALEIWSDKRFEDAHRLYKRYGAETVGDRICDDPDVSPEWGLILRL